MDAKLSLIKDLIDKVAEYEDKGNAAPMDLDHFALFLQHKGKESFNMRELGGEMEMEVQERGKEQETQIAILVTFIYRYAKLYSKKILQDTPLSTLDDFSYLIVLLTHKSMSKTEMINKNVHEKTTGMEIIKRLLKNRLIMQFDDENDKRSQRVTITEAGRGVIFSILDKMEGLSKIMTGNLTAMEKNTLGKILTKLDHFHYDIFMNDRNESLENIIDKKVNPHIG